MEPKKYRKRPVVVEAIQWTGENHAGMCDFIDPEVFEIRAQKGLIIYTLEGAVHASPGDYIVKGVHGEFYPCKPDVFAETYEEVEETSTCTATGQPCAVCQTGPCGSRREAHNV